MRRGLFGSEFLWECQKKFRDWGKLRGEEDFALAAGLLGEGESGVELLEGKGLIDGLVEGAVGEELSKLEVEFVDFLAWCLGEPFGDPEAAEGEIFENEEAVGDGEWAAGHGAVGDVVGVFREELGEAEGAVAADGVAGELGAVGG